MPTIACAHHCACPPLHVPTITCSQPAVASHLLGIADPEGDGVEMDEAASLGLKGRGKTGLRATAAAFPAALLISGAVAATLQVCLLQMCLN